LRRTLDRIFASSRLQWGYSGSPEGPGSRLPFNSRSGIFIRGKPSSPLMAELADLFNQYGYQVNKESIQPGETTLDIIMIHIYEKK
jgi:hypothetical protein